MTIAMTPAGRTTRSPVPDPGEYKNKAARAKLHWYGTRNFDAVLTAWVNDVENDGYNGVPYAPFANAGANANLRSSSSTADHWTASMPTSIRRMVPTTAVRIRPEPTSR
jgi:hypothetical protein